MSLACDKALVLEGVSASVVHLASERKLTVAKAPRMANAHRPPRIDRNQVYWLFRFSPLHWHWP